MRLPSESDFDLKVKAVEPLLDESDSHQYFLPIVNLVKKYPDLHLQVYHGQISSEQPDQVLTSGSMEN